VAALPDEIRRGLGLLMMESFQQGEQNMREVYRHPENRYIVASLIGAAVIDDPREFGNWCRHGYELNEQFRRGERDERNLLARQTEALRDQGVDVGGGDRIPLGTLGLRGGEPSPEQLARWNERHQRYAEAGAYSAPGDPGDQRVPGARYDQSVSAPDRGSIIATVQDLVRQELANLQGSAYGANAMPQAPAPSWPTPVVRPTPVWTNGGPNPGPGGYVPGRRY
jgi:hypothetical protein